MVGLGKMVNRRRKEEMPVNAFKGGGGRGGKWSESNEQLLLHVHSCANYDDIIIDSLFCLSFELTYLLLSLSSYGIDRATILFNVPNSRGFRCFPTSFPSDVALSFTSLFLFSTHLVATLSLHSSSTYMLFLHPG